MEANQGKDQDGHNQYHKQKAGAATRMCRAVFLDCFHFQWYVSLIGIYYLVLSTVVSKYPLDIRHQRH